MVKKYSFLFIVLAAVIWSADGLLRRNLYSLPPTVVVLYEHVLGLILLLPFILPKWQETKKLNRNDLLAFVWVALLSGVLGTVMYTAALGKIQYIQYSVVVLLQQTQPLIVILFARLLLKETITQKYIAWAIGALFAVYLISFPKLTVNLTDNSQQIVAALLALGAAFAWGSSTAFSRFTLRKLSPAITTGIRFGFTIPIAFVFVLFTHSTTQLTAVSQTQWIALLAIALTTGMVGLLIYYHGLKHTYARVSAIAELAWPLSAVLIGYFFLGEKLSITQLLGAAALLLIMYKVSQTQKTYEQLPA